MQCRYILKFANNCAFSEASSISLLYLELDFRESNQEQIPLEHFQLCLRGRRELVVCDHLGSGNLDLGHGEALADTNAEAS